MPRARRWRVVLALAAWLLPWAGAAATGLHLALDDHHRPAAHEVGGPDVVQGEAHTHDAPAQAAAVVAVGSPRFRLDPASTVALLPVAPDATLEREDRGFAFLRPPGSGPPRPPASPLVLRI